MDQAQACFPLKEMKIYAPERQHIQNSSYANRPQLAAEVDGNFH
jgi:hypothetical protein